MKFFIFFPLIIISSFSFSQDDEIKRLPKTVSDQFIVDITIDNWLNVPKGIQTRLWSTGVSVAIYNDIKFGSSPFGFAFGIGISSHNVHHNGMFIETPSTDTTSAFTSFIPRTTSFKKNKLSTNYIEIPFEFRIRTIGERPFRFYPGFKIGYMFNIHTKVIDDSGKSKFYTFPNADPLRYGATVRIGYSKINFIGFYGLNSIFKSGKGPELIPWSAGISLII